jgi:hypothetical protein
MTAVTPWKCTLVAPDRLHTVTVTVLPTLPLVGLMQVMVGAAAWPIGPSGVALMAAEEFASRIVGAPGRDGPSMFESAGWDVTVPR